eukprot:5063706-Ditylum_brightwellii.AAC.1
MGFVKHDTIHAVDETTSDTKDSHQEMIIKGKDNTNILIVAVLDTRIFFVTEETRIFPQDGRARVGAEHGLFFASCSRCVSGLLVVIYHHNGACMADILLDRG